MEDFDLDSVWKNSDEKADKFYQSVEPEVLEMARKNSKNVIERIRKNVIGEWITSLILFAGIVVYAQRLGHLWFALAVSAIALILTWIPYQKMLEKIGEAPTKNLAESLETKIKVLDTFIKRLEILMWVLFPVGFVLGLFSQYLANGGFHGEVNPQLLIGVIIGSVLLIGAMYWLILKKYIPWLYGNPKQELEQILSNLRKE